MRCKSFPLGLATELKTKKAWHNHPHRGALCEKQEHGQLPLMTQGEESFGYCLRQLTEEAHSSQFLALKTLVEPKNNKKKRMKEKKKHKNGPVRFFKRPERFVINYYCDMRAVTGYQT